MIQRQLVLTGVLILLLSSAVPGADDPPVYIQAGSFEYPVLYPNITIDGILSPGEWVGIVYEVPWYMDADPENYDGTNYMYLAEDFDNLYVGLDLVSDQTNDETGEWVGLWLNTNETHIDEPLPMDGFQSWHDHLDRGMESLIYDVDNGQPMPFFNYSLPDVSFSSKLQSLDELIPITGSIDGTLEDIEVNLDNKYLNMTSVFNGTDHVYQLDVEILIPNYYDLFPDLYTDNTYWVQMVARFLSNVTLDHHYLSIRDSNGDIDYTNSKQTKSIYTGTGVGAGDDIVAEPGNFTSDDRVVFSFTGVHSAPFNTSFNQILPWFSTPMRTQLAQGMLEYPYSSVKNYEIAYTFGGSENNATAHRMFEFKIPKTELEGYEDQTHLGIFPGGYGTLAIQFPDSHHWVYAQTIESDSPYEKTLEYHYFDILMKEWSPLSDPVLEGPDISTDGYVYLNWTDDPNVDRWFLLRHTEEITELTIEDAVIVAEPFSNDYIDHRPDNGTYWYMVVAIDFIEYPYFSNSISVSVEIPESITETATVDYSTTFGTPTDETTSDTTSESETSSDTSVSPTDTETSSDTSELTSDTSETTVGDLPAFGFSVVCIVVILERFRKKSRS